MKSNKQVKQMITDVTLQGRKAIWFGEESEIFAAKNLEQLENEFGEKEEFPDAYGNVVSADWRFWWKPCLCEKDYKNGKYITHGQPAYNRQGELTVAFEYLPLICGVYGNTNDVAQVSSSYT
ncbi:hypothetical protein [Photobacterium alginatilyticum]|uniref:Uncharacterized protein n=1 Tax=Photobacterium alginatilyticum TaxID=1775171 RepID=A0ABW9YN73_9GAMM|nr:hypothetical protein [Photobacterium alginatilyticum]NBI54681.1 hypothetical protein [Photobacterium alginatilyticum]